MAIFNIDQTELVELKVDELTKVEGGGIIGLVLTIAGIICNYYGV